MKIVSPKQEQMLVPCDMPDGFDATTPRGAGAAT